MLTTDALQALRERFEKIRSDALTFFQDVLQELGSGGKRYGAQWGDLLSVSLHGRSTGLMTEIKRLSIEVGGAARGSPLIAEADLQDLRHSTRRMVASLRFRSYRYFGVYVHHDEGTVLGVDPPSQEEHPVTQLEEAPALFEQGAAAFAEILDLLSPSESVAPATTPTEAYRPNTAFIMMAIDKSLPELDDVKNGIKDVFKEFGITAIRSDEIEHEDVITDRILQEVMTSEFLIADLTYERPSVYYEIGHAHAHDKRVMLVRKKDTHIHFDLAHRNCPEYENITQLKELLRKRLEVVTNRPRKT